MTALYAVDQYGHKTFNIDILNKDQCEEVAKICQNDAFKVRLKMVAKIVCAVALTTAALFTTIAVAKLAFLGFYAIRVYEASTAEVYAYLIGYGINCGLCAYSAVNIAKYAKNLITNDQAYAKHLDDQALAAKNRAKKLDNPSVAG